MVIRMACGKLEINWTSSMNRFPLIEQKLKNLIRKNQILIILDGVQEVSDTNRGNN